MAESNPIDHHQMVHHDIFLSHSGKEKYFVNDLNKVLYSKGYTTFFDITHHSLPPGQNFPSIISQAAASCKLALVVLSHDFICSKWPMAELCMFVDAQSSSAEKLQILPIFYKLSPSDLKLEQNRQKWRMLWEDSAKKDPARISVAKCEHALDILDKLNGITYDPSKLLGGELSYIQKIVSSISTIVKPFIEYGMLHVRGRQRLCKIICDVFTELECLTPTPEVCLLGMYGLPGSGKSTISKCMCNHYGHQFNGRTFYLELHANPTKEELLKISKDLLKKVTDFSDMVDLGIVTDLDQVYPLLMRYLRRSSLFLVVDNVMPHDLAIEFVQRILTCDFRAGSKLLLVGHTYHVLQLLRNDHRVQKKRREEKCKYAYGSVRMPSINKEEAIQILLESAKDERLPESCAPVEDELDSKDREIVETVIRMSGFVHNNNQEYLPMAVKIMGVAMMEENLEVWANDMKAFWKKIELSKVHLYREEVVKKLVQKIFDKLPQHLQFLFLDVALFILPHECGHGRHAYILSIMHKCTPEKIEMDMVRLQKHCFIENVNRGLIRVHDVFLEFAAACQDSCMYYSFTHRHGGLSLANELSPPSEEATVLRAVVLELNEEHERFDFWIGFASVKALVLRNCKSLRVVSFPMGFKSLLILDVDNCPQLTCVEAEEEKSIADSVRSFAWNNEKSGSVIQVAHSRRPALMEVGGFALKMRWLQDLRLVNTSIKCLEDMGKCWPLLRQIEIKESCLEYFKMGNLPYLEYFAFGSVNSGDYGHRKWAQESYETRRRSRFEGKNLLAGCPNLKSVRIVDAGIENGLGAIGSSRLQTLTLHELDDAENFPDLAKATQTLTNIQALQWRQLKHINFMHQFEVLQHLSLQGCPNLMQVDGLDHLISLHELVIQDCEELHTVSGLSGLLRLERFQVQNCDSLERLSGVRDLVSLKTFNVGKGCLQLEMPHSDLQNLTQLVSLHYWQHAFLPGVLQLSNFSNLRKLRVYSDSDAMDSEEEEECVEEEEKSLGEEEEFLGLRGARQLLGVSHLISIKKMTIWDICDLASLNDTAFLLPLVTLKLGELPNLTSANGIGTLVCLRRLEIDTCESIEELPSLSAMLELEYLSLKKCSKLKSVDGLHALRRLTEVSLIECEEMGEFPLSSQALPTLLTSLDIRGSKFVSIDTMVQWMVTLPNDENRYIFFHASLEALKWEFRENICEAEARMRVIETAGVELIDRLIPNDDDCYDFTAGYFPHRNTDIEWQRALYMYEKITDPLAKLLEDVSRKSKRWLREHLQSNTLFKVHVLCCLLVRLDIDTVEPDDLAIDATEMENLELFSFD